MNQLRMMAATLVAGGSMGGACDAPSDWQLLFQDPATPLAAGAHNYTMI